MKGILLGFFDDKGPITATARNGTMHRCLSCPSELLREKQQSSAQDVLQTCATMYYFCDVCI